jgi:hypothetical protein
VPPGTYSITVTYVSTASAPVNVGSAPNPPGGLNPPHA